jgi:hypothetical protein
MIFFGMFPSIKAMIIIAWNGSGKLSSIFEGDVFKKVLSIFITSTILNFGQGREKSSLKDFCSSIAHYFVELTDLFIYLMSN